MILLLEALAALRDTGTVSAAASRLRLSQSAVSKRLKALETSVGYPVIEPDGRRVRLTPRALALLDRAAPLVAELRALSATEPAAGPSVLSLAMADSVASSWGPAAVRTALEGLPDLRLELHVHRSVLVLESVRLGRYQLGLCAETTGDRDLTRALVLEEPMVLVRAAGAKAGAPLITIEPGAATWKAVEPLLRRHAPQVIRRERVAVESFAAAAQLVRAGFGDGLLPQGVARQAGLAARPLPGVARRVSLHCRKTVALLPVVARLAEALRDAAGA